MRAGLNHDAPTGLSDPDVCARCAAVGPTCCRLSPGQEELCFPVSDMEKGRMDEHSGLRRGGVVMERNSPAFLRHMERLFPKERREVRALFPAHAWHARLAVDASGACVFLGPRGCALPNEARPYYCRLFPFWVSGGRLTAFVANGCLACKEGRTAADMLRLFNTSAPKLLDLHCRLRMAWGLPPREGMPNVTRFLAGHAT